MPNVERGDIQLYTYRTGLLSRVGHDLRLSVARFRIEWEDGEVSGRFWPESIEVDGAMKDGALQSDRPSASDRRKIVRNIRKDILKTRAHPEIRFDGSYREIDTEPGDEETVQVGGELEIRGVREAIEMVVHRRDGRMQGELELKPSRWGIEPYRALLGSLQLEDRVGVELDLPA